MTGSSAGSRVDVGAVEIIAPNFKKRLSGVTSTIIQLVPLQGKKIGIATLGPGLPTELPHLRWRQFPQLWRRPKSRPFRIWHARRNVEMLAGIVLKNVLRAPLRLVFTSASQRHHTKWTRLLISRMDRVIATSEKTAAYLTVPNMVVMHGIDTDRFCVPDDRRGAAQAVGLDPEMRYIGCFGRIRRQKGTDLFVDAMIRTLPGHSGWSAVVAGRATGQHAEFDAQLRRRVAQAGLAERILFVGEHTDIPRWYRALSLFVAPQRWEGFGLTPLEAMASGVPVVATDVGAFSELVDHGNTGLVVPPDDLDAMSAAVETFLSDEDMLKSQGLRARERVVAHFRLETEASNLIDIYERLFDAASGAEPAIRRF